jgi:tetratricopeptide (TPR) repeat protein
MRAILTSLTLALLTVYGPLALAQDRQPTSWLLFEQGNALLSRKEYGQALQQYKNAIGSAGIFPEAEMAIGDVYKEEGELELARKQYEKAYNLRNAFYISQSKYDVLYKLAKLFEDQDLFKLMEDRLSDIVADDKHFAESETLQQRTQMERIFFEKGLDRILTLYTFEDTFATGAHSELGWFYYRTGRYSMSVSHLLYSVVYRVSELKTFMTERDVGYQFSTLKDLLAGVRGSAEASKYMDQAGLFKDLYYLAGSTFASGYPQHSAGVWKIISESDAAGNYRELSRRQIKTPFMEPLLGVN